MDIGGIANGIGDILGGGFNKGDLYSGLGSPGSSFDFGSVMLMLNYSDRVNSEFNGVLDSFMGFDSVGKRPSKSGLEEALIGALRARIS